MAAHSLPTLQRYAIKTATAIPTQIATKTMAAEIAQVTISENKQKKKKKKVTVKTINVCAM